jgi:hypothetical protein
MIFFSAWNTSAPQRRPRGSWGAHGDDHELLQVQAVVGVRAAVDDVHHRHGQLHAAHAAEVAVQRQAGFFGGGAGHGHGDGQHGVGAQAALVVGAVQVDQGLVEEGLLGGVQAQHGFGDFGVDVLDGLEHALAQVAALVAVTQLDGFARAGGAPRARRRGPSRPIPAARRIRRWGCRGCPALRGLRCQRWHSWVPFLGIGDFDEMAAALVPRAWKYIVFAGNFKAFDHHQAHDGGAFAAWRARVYSGES